MHADKKIDLASVSSDQIDLASEVLTLLSDPTRIRIVLTLQENGELSVNALAEAVGKKPSGVSQHLARMRDEGLIGSEREAQRIHYFITHPAVQQIITTLKTIYCP